MRGGTKQITIWHSNPSARDGALLISILVDWRSGKIVLLSKKADQELQRSEHHAGASTFITLDRYLRQLPKSVGISTHEDEDHTFLFLHRP